MYKAEQVDLSHTYFREFGKWHNLEKLVRNTTNQKLEHSKIIQNPYFYMPDLMKSQSRDKAI